MSSNIGVRKCYTGRSEVVQTVSSSSLDYLLLSKIKLWGYCLLARVTCLSSLKPYHYWSAVSNMGTLELLSVLDTKDSDILMD